MEQPQFHLMEYSTSVKEASTIVTVAKTVIIINHLVARAKSGSLKNSKIHCATAVVKMREAVFAFAKIQSHLHYLLQLHQ